MGDTFNIYGCDTIKYKLILEYGKGKNLVSKNNQESKSERFSLRIQNATKTGDSEVFYITY